MKFAIAIGMLAAALASGQIFRTTSVESRGRESTVTFSDQTGGLRFAIVAGAPYSADRVVTQANMEFVQHLARDGKGRTRIERPAMPGFAGTRIVEIADPVAGFSYLIEEAHKVAHRVVLAPPPDLRPRADDGSGADIGDGIHVKGGMSTSGAPAPQVTSEELESKTMEGVKVQGTRSTMNGPGGKQVVETWVSPDLHEMVRLERRDAMGNVRVTRLEKIRRGEPAPALFEIPAGYKIVDEKAPFRVVFEK